MDLIDRARELASWYPNTEAGQVMEILIARLEAAEKYIELSPCDPDIYPDQHAAWLHWRALRDGRETP